MVKFENGMLTTQITDTGIGISKDDLKKLFTFFGKIDASKNINRGGMGLGLTISKMILQQLNGDINCSSVFGKGSKFTFSFPVEVPEQNNLINFQQR